MSIFLKFIFFSWKVERHTHSFFKGWDFSLWNNTTFAHNFSVFGAMLKIHFSNNLSKHFVNVRTMFSTCFYKGTAPYLSQGLEEKKKENIINTYYTSGGTIIHFILGDRFTNTLWRKSAIKEVNDWVHYISFFPKKVLLMYISFSSSPQVCLQYVKLCSKGS